MSDTPRIVNFDDIDFGDDDTCPNCAGEGVIYMCVSDYACVDPESGCDLCERACDWCRQRQKAVAS